MAITVAINTAFAHLSSRDIWKHGVGSSPSREREAVVDITFGASDNYVTNGVVIDFSVLQRIKQVYFCQVVQKSLSNYASFVPDTNNAANLGKLKLFTAAGVEVSNGNTLTNNATFRVLIRGI